MDGLVETRGNVQVVAIIQIDNWTCIYVKKIVLLKRNWYTLNKRLIFQ